MTGIISKAKTVLALGIPSVARILRYKLGVKMGLNPVKRITAPVSIGPFFKGFSSPMKNQKKRIADTPLVAFGIHPLPNTEAAPRWRKSCLRPEAIEMPLAHWWEIPDFDPAVGDIKEVWELSRFGWLPAWALNAQQGDGRAAARAESWLTNWCSKNPPYLGPNWKCGQEASIRIIHLAATALILDEVEAPLSNLRQLIATHLQRIAPTIGYAVAQDNNHGTSEAAALFVGGSWLASDGHRQARAWEKLGRKWLENRAARLIATDGTFSQYSVVYHRLMLDTLSFAEIWRERLARSPFSPTFLSRCSAATEWLLSLVDPFSGNAPNLGANDGTHLLNVTNADYRDFRPSVQIAANLFLNKSHYAPGPWDDQLRVFNIQPRPHQFAKAASRLFDQGGIALVQNRQARAILRYPRFHFRPSQADALHLDLWLGHLNLIRDGGTFSYNSTPEDLEYFSGTASHSTAQFDGRNQMTRVSRFLYGDWLKTSGPVQIVETGTGQCCRAGYRDSWGASHIREILLREDSLLVTDTLFGFSSEAVVRWRLAPADWKQASSTCFESEYARVEVDASSQSMVARIGEGFESLHYAQRTRLPVVEITLTESATVSTRFFW